MPLGETGGLMPLPKSLTPLHIETAVDYVERGTAELIDIYIEQAKVFSAIVGIFGAKALHAVSPYWVSLSVNWTLI